jgi:hypothetical protein
MPGACFTVSEFARRRHPACRHPTGRTRQQGFALSCRSGRGCVRGQRPARQPSDEQVPHQRPPLGTPGPNPCLRLGGRNNWDIWRRARASCRLSSARLAKRCRHPSRSHCAEAGFVHPPAPPDTGHARIGFAFEPARWDGEPVNAEAAQALRTCLGRPRRPAGGHRALHRCRDHSRRARLDAHPQRLVTVDSAVTTPPGSQRDQRF